MMDSAYWLVIDSQYMETEYPDLLPVAEKKVQPGTWQVHTPRWYSWFGYDTVSLKTSGTFGIFPWNAEESSPGGQGEVFCLPSGCIPDFVKDVFVLIREKE
jgi:hypothetical protein